MSGDLKDPSKSIPSGTLAAVLTSYIVYVGLILMVGSTTARDTLQTNLYFLQEISFAPFFIGVTIIASSVSSAMTTLIGSTRILQAVAIDDLLPILDRFKGGSKKSDEPIGAALLSYILIQGLLLVGDLNAIAPFVTMFFLLADGITNLACLGLSVSSTPNFRPTFKYFRPWTAGLGCILSFAGMFFVDSVYATISVILMVCLFVFLYYSDLPSTWGELFQALVYHQVRKYLLALDIRKGTRVETYNECVY